MFWLFRGLYFLTMGIIESERVARVEEEDKRLDMRVREMLADAERRRDEHAGLRPSDRSAPPRALPSDRSAPPRALRRRPPKESHHEARPTDGRARVDPVLLWSVGVVGVVWGVIVHFTSGRPATTPWQGAPLSRPSAGPQSGGALPAPDARDAKLVQWRVEDGGNGHYYEFVRANVSWTEAKRGAEARSVLEVRGHLATITSAQEDEFLRRALPIRRGWLGGYQDHNAPGYAEPAGGWRWVTGEPWGYTNWAAGEPNHFPPGEDYLQLRGTHWNDMPEAALASGGYYVEYPVPAGAKGK
jgi:hypothetical protein